MLTLPIAAPVRDERAPYRPYRATVVGIARMTPHFTRITFSSDEFEFFGTDRLDQRIKILFPLPGVGISDIGADDANPDWHASWRELPAEVRNPFRTYTVRDIRVADRELDVDFVAHGDGGPAARWLLSAAVGDELVIVGPDSRSIHSAVGIDWHPGDARRVVLAGDETAVPAICSIVESLPPHVEARVFISVPSSADKLEIASNASVEWLSRDNGDDLETALREWVSANRPFFASALTTERQELDDVDVDRDILWDSPADGPGDFYAWLAGESSMIKTLRRFLVSETGIDRSRVAFMGYWRLGKAEAQQ